MVAGQTQNLWKLKDLGGIVTKESVVREGPGRYGSKVYHGTSHVHPARSEHPHRSVKCRGKRFSRALWVLRVQRFL